MISQQLQESHGTNEAFFYDSASGMYSFISGNGSGPSEQLDAIQQEQQKLLMPKKLNAMQKDRLQLLTTILSRMKNEMKNDNLPDSEAMVSNLASNAWRMTSCTGCLASSNMDKGIL